MAKLEAVCDSGPLIHLAEIGAYGAFGIFSKVLVPPDVFTEVSHSNLSGADELRSSKLISVFTLTLPAKNHSKLLFEKYGLGLDESCALALAKQMNVSPFLTDDLAARSVSKVLGLEPHGTLGILLRAYRDGKRTKEETRLSLKAISERSSLFITSDLMHFVLSELDKEP